MRVSHFPSMLVLMASLAATSAKASDFSSLFQPSFARIYLVSSERLLQAECAGLAAHLAQTRPGSDRSAAIRLNEEVARRLGAELGDPGVGRDYVQGQSQHYVSPAYDAETIRDLVATMEPKCRSLIDQAGKGERALAEALGPVPTAPLALPGPERCLAIVSYGAERKAQVMGEGDEFVTVLRGDWIETAAPNEAAKRTASLAKDVDALRQSAPDDNRLNAMISACLPTLHEAAMRLRETGGSVDLRTEN